MSATILLVEDEALLREMTRADLEDLGLEVVCAADFGQAWQALEADQAIGVLITDIRMPGECNGWELARRARAVRPQLSVIYISGYSADELQPVPGGVFLKKPYRVEELEKALAGFGALGGRHRAGS